MDAVLNARPKFSVLLPLYEGYLELHEYGEVDLGGPLCNLESSAVAAGFAGQSMLWEVTHPRTEALSPLAGFVPAFRCLMLHVFCHKWSLPDDIHLLLRSLSRGV